MIWGLKGFGSEGGTSRRPAQRIPQRRIAAVTTMLAGLATLALPAGAVEPIVIPTDTVVRGQEGEVHLLGEVSTGSEAGCEAEVSAMAHNNNSVHVDNTLIVASGGAQVVVPDVEAQPGIMVNADGALTLSDTITVMVQLGPADPGRPNSIFSGGVTVHVTCAPDTTSTTVAPTTTTTTTQPTTTTTPPENNSATTTPPNVLGTSTTTLPGGSTTVPPVTGSTLPFTGPDRPIGTAMAGGSLLLLGLALMRAAREPQVTD